MSFLAPWALLFVLATGIPLWIHLRRRKVEFKVDFPAVRYLLRAEREHARELKVRNLLLMLLRVAVVLLVALAAAQPLARVLVGGHGPTALVIVVDNSMSSGAVSNGRSALTSLQEAAQRVVAGAKGGDKLWLITADGAVIGGQRAEIATAIDRLTPLGGSGDLVAAVRRAVVLAPGAGLPAARVVVVTDGQANAWRGELDVAGVPVTIHALADAPPANHAVTRVVADPPHWAPRGTLRATVAARGNAPLTWRAAIGASTLSRGTINGGGAIEMGAAPDARGWVAGSVELPADELRADDARPFALHVGPAPAVHAELSAGPFARTALQALAADGRVREGAGVAITTAENLVARPALILAPSDPTKVALANRALERAQIPWRFGERRTGPAIVHGDGLDGATLQRWYVLTPAGAAASDTLARVGADPLVVAGEGWVLSAAGLDPADGDLPLKAGFLPWLDRTISRRLAADAGPVIELEPGATAVRPTWATGLESPDGTVRPLDGARIIAPSSVGVYFLRRGGERAGAVVVAPSADESVLDRAPVATLAAHLRGADVRTAADADQLASRAWSGTAPRPFATFLLLAALLTLIAESVAARRDRDEV